MAFRRFKRRKGGSRRRGYRKKKYSVSVGKLASKRVDTLIERRMVSLAKKEIAKDRVNLTLRRQINAYDPATNHFAVPVAALTFDGWGPLVIEDNLRLAADVYLATNSQPVFTNNPLTTDNEVTYPQIYDVNTALPVIPVSTLNGTRQGPAVRIDSIHVKLRVELHESTALAYTSSSTATFAIFRVQKDFATSSTIPSVRELFAAGRYRPWNYSSKIDTPTEELLGEPWKIKKLAERTVILKTHDAFPRAKFTSLTWKPKSSVMHKFIANSADGNSLEYKYLFAARSNIPNIATGTIQDCQPTFHAVVFLNYHE